MKKLITLLAVSITAIAIASADPILVGHGFVNFNALGSTPASGDGSAIGAFGDNIGAGGGLGINIPFGGYFGVQPEVDFYINRIGFKNESSGNVTAYKYLSLDIPVLFTVKLEKWNFKVGPYVSIPLGDLTTQIKYSGGGTSNPVEFDIDNGANVGLLLGVGYEERLGMGRIVFGANYMLDFMPTKSKVVLLGTPIVDDVFTRRGLQLDIGYKLPLSFF